MDEIKSKAELKAIANEVLAVLRPRGLQIWQAKEVLRFAISLIDWERLK